MSSHSNEYAYGKEFEGNLQANTGPVPIRVTTRLRLMRETVGTDIRRYDNPIFDTPPKYSIGGDGSLPMHPSQQAVGRHYFTW